VLDARTRLALAYDEALAELEWLNTPFVPEDYDHGYQAYVCLFRPEEPSLDNLQAQRTKRNELMAGLEDGGISTRQGTHAAALQGYYREKYGLRPEGFPNAALAEGMSLTLPLYAQMTDDEQAAVVQALQTAESEL